MSCPCQHSQLCLSHLCKVCTDGRDNWIPKIMAQFCYLRLYFCVNNVSRRLLQWIARIINGLKHRPMTRYRTYSNQISTRLFSKKGLWQDMHGKISTRSWLVRLDLLWLHDLYFQLPWINWTGGRVHVNLFLDFSRPTPKSDWLAERRKIRWRNNVRCGEVKVNS